MEVSVSEMKQLDMDMRRDIRKKTSGLAALGGILLLLLCLLAVIWYELLIYWEMIRSNEKLIPHDIKVYHIF